MSEPGETIGKLLGAQLRWLREERSMTQAHVSRLTGIARPIVARIERGVHVPALETVSRFAAALGVDPVNDVLVILEPSCPGLLSLLAPLAPRTVVYAELD